MQEVEKFLGSDEFTRPTEKIIAAAKFLQKKTRRQTVESILDFLRENLRYVNLEKESPKEWRRLFKKRTAEEILTTKTTYGCSNSAVLFAALARASGIPVQFIEGKRIRKSGGHCWAEVFIDEQWIVVDPASGSIGINPAENTRHGPYVVLSRSLGPSDGAMPSYEAWCEVEKQWRKDRADQLLPPIY